MNRHTSVALAAVFASALSMVGARAATVGASGIQATRVAAMDGDKTSEADKRAKAIECSKQADAKQLHGAARMKFRAACKEKSNS